MALIGSISINMSVSVQKMVAGMNKASAAVKGFGAHAAKSVGNFGGIMADAGRATKGVIDQFYVAPLRKAAGVVGGIGKEIGQSLGWAGKGLAGPFNRAGNAVGAFSVMLGRNLAQVGIGGAVGAFRLLSKVSSKTFSGLRSGINALGGTQAKILGVGIGVAFYKVAKAASGLAEQANRAKVMFGDSADSVMHQADVMADAYGTVRSESLRTTSAMAGMFQGIGYTKSASADLSIHFLKMATDLSSIANIPVAEALEKIESGLAGEVRPLREVGVFMSEAAIKSKAAQMGIAKLGTELTEQQKIQARVAFITEKLAYAQGDLAKTAGSAENATRGFMGRLENLAATVGTALLPIVGGAMLELQTGVEALSMTWSAWTKGVVNDQVGVVGAVGEQSKAMGWLQKSVGFVADAFQTLKIGFYLVQSYITSGIGFLVKGFGVVGKVIDSIVEKISGKKLGIGDFLDTYSADLKRLSNEQYKIYQKELGKAPASDGVNAYFDAARDRIKASQAEAMKPGVDVTKLAPKSEAVEKKAAEPKFASAAQAGSKEAANAILQSRYGAGAGKQPEEQTAKNTARANVLLEKIATHLNPANAGAAAGSALASLF